MIILKTFWIENSLFRLKLRPKISMSAQKYHFLNDHFSPKTLICKPKISLFSDLFRPKNLNLSSCLIYIVYYFKFISNFGIFQIKMNILDFEITFECLRNSLSLLVESSILRTLTGHYDRIFNFSRLSSKNEFSQTFDLVYKMPKRAKSTKTAKMGSGDAGPISKKSKKTKIVKIDLDNCPHPFNLSSLAFSPESSQLRIRFFIEYVGFE